jgi:hypothetical protein
MLLSNLAERTMRIHCLQVRRHRCPRSALAVRPLHGVAALLALRHRSRVRAYVFAFECACTDLLEDPGVSMHMHSHSFKALI